MEKEILTTSRSCSISKKGGKEERNSHHKQLVFYEDPLSLLELGVLPLVAPSQVVHVEQHHLERKNFYKRNKKEKKRLPQWQWKTKF